MIERFYPLIMADGRWIDHKDLFLVSRMSYEDNQRGELVVQLFDCTSRSSGGQVTFASAIDELQSREQIERMPLRRDIRLSAKATLYCPSLKHFRPRLCGNCSLW